MVYVYNIVLFLHLASQNQLEVLQYKVLFNFRNFLRHHSGFQILHLGVTN